MSTIKENNFEDYEILTEVQVLQHIESIPNYMNDEFLLAIYQNTIKQMNNSQCKYPLVLNVRKC
jgi:hypothetical protein